jgi:hypothetical protein
MDTIGWGILLLVLKWVFIGLVYLILAVVLLAVRRELSTRVQDNSESASVLPGRLRVVQPGGDNRLTAGSLISLKPVTRLGGEKDNDIILRDPFISGHHARLQWDGVAWWVEDLDSRNGTFIQQARMAPFTPAQLENGNILRLGDMSFEFLE